MQINFDNLQDFMPDDESSLTEIGHGTFSRVKLCQHKDFSDKKYALKIQQIENDIDKFFIDQEINLHKQINHENIIKIEGHAWFQDKVYIFLEYANNNDLFEYIYNKNLTDKQKHKIFKQICLAIQACHKQDILHRDLKPENILLTNNFDAKLCDFGWSCKGSQISQLKSNCGTQDYNAPEIINAQTQTNAVDIWALGIILYEIYHNKLPFQVQEKFNFKKAIKKIKFKKNINQNLKDLVLKMLKIKSSERLNIDEVLQHPFLKKQFNLCDYILQTKQRQNGSLFKEININASQKKSFNLFDESKCIQIDKKQNQKNKNILFQKGKILLQKTSTLSTQASGEQCLQQILKQNQDLPKQKICSKKKSNFKRKFSLLENNETLFLVCENEKLDMRKSLTKIVLQNSKFQKLQKQNTFF